MTIGKTTWRTPIFPEAERGYCLPIKRAVRKAENLDDGTTAKVKLLVLV